MRKTNFIAVLSLFIFMWQAPMAQTLDADEFRWRLLAERGVLIDVRSPYEYRTEHIRNAINLDVDSPTFPFDIRRLDSSRVYFLYCGVGKRSARARQILTEAGFRRVYDLRNGLDGWKLYHFPTDDTAVRKFN